MSVHTHETDAQLTLDPAAHHAERVARKLSFATDEQLAGWLRPTIDRLAMVENGIADFKARIPGMERECAAIRQNVSAVLGEIDRQAA